MAHRKNTYTHMLPDGNVVTAHMMLPCTHVIVGRLNADPHFSILSWAMTEKAASFSTRFKKPYVTDVAVEAINGGSRRVS